MRESPLHLEPPRRQRLLRVDLAALDPRRHVVVGEQPEIGCLCGARLYARSAVLDAEVVTHLTVGRIAHYLLDCDRQRGHGLR